MVERQRPGNLGGGADRLQMAASCPSANGNSRPVTVLRLAGKLPLISARTDTRRVHLARLDERRGFRE